MSSFHRLAPRSIRRRARECRFERRHRYLRALARVSRASSTDARDRVRGRRRASDGFERDLDRPRDALSWTNRIRVNHALWGFERYRERNIRTTPSRGKSSRGFAGRSRRPLRDACLSTWRRKCSFVACSRGACNYLPCDCLVVTRARSHVARGRACSSSARIGSAIDRCHARRSSRALYERSRGREAIDIDHVHLHLRSYPLETAREDREHEDLL